MLVRVILITTRETCGGFIFRALAVFITVFIRYFSDPCHNFF
jgi:hypothetical protein